MTVPDLSLTVNELLKNHVRGKGIGVSENQGEYFEDYEIPIFDDLVDAHEYKKELEERKRDVEKQIKDLREKPEKDKKQKQLEFDKKVDELAEMEKAQLELEKRRITKKPKKDGQN